jgi:ABC-2 type transporter
MHLLAFTALSLGFFIGASIKDIHMLRIVTPMVLVISIIYGGNIASSDTIPVALSWLQYLSMIKYAYSALFQTEFTGLKFHQNLTTEFAGFSTGNQVISTFKMDAIPVYVCFLALMALSLAFQLAAYVALRRSTRPVMNFSL